MNKRKLCLFVNWKAVDGAAHGKRRLSLRQNDKELYTCPVKLCLHTDFKSSRGLRKHINNKHAWFYYFDVQPEVKREEIESNQPVRKKACTSKKPAFTLDIGIGKEFVTWLCTSCGGGKNVKEAIQIAKRAMKFLMEALGTNESDIDLKFDFVDCCLSSAAVLIQFLKTLECEWRLSSSGALNYVKAIADLIDFRKSSGLPDNTLRCFTVTEVYVRRAKENLRKKKNIECNRNLDLETLIAKKSWASIEDMEKVIPFHLETYKTTLMKCKFDSNTLSKQELVFCTRFITALLFLRVKCSRPMTFQYLTVEMIQKAKGNGGFIDQTEFKTAAQYVFDTLILTDDVMQIIDSFIENIRPLLNPKCDYLLLSTNGTQFQSLTTAMTMLVKQAIGKFINPTRYRQIVETESTNRLSRDEQQTISEDQKHCSNVAKIYYKKKHSRQVAIDGKKCMDKMTENVRTLPQNSISGILNDIDTHFDQSVLEKSRFILEKDFGTSQKQLFHIQEKQGECSKTGVNNSPYEPINIEEDDTTTTDLTITYHSKSPPVTIGKSIEIPNDDIVIKKETVSNFVAKKGSSKVKFSAEEDRNLRAGITKHGKKAWAIILKDKSLEFHKTRTRDSLRMRAESAAFKNTSPHEL